MKIRSLAAKFVATNLIAFVGACSLFAQAPPQNPNNLGGGRPPFNGGGQPANGGPTAPPMRPAAPTGPVGPIAVVDMQEVFKFHSRLEFSMEEMKAEIQRFEAEQTAKQKSGQKKVEQLRELAPGTPDFKKLEEEVARLQSEFQLDIQLKQKEMGEREAKIYYSTYLEVQDIIKEYAERNGIRLVLRHSRLEIDPAKRDTVMLGIMRPVLLERGIDITDVIVAQVSRGPAAPAASNNSFVPRDQAQRPQIPSRSGLK